MAASVEIYNHLTLMQSYGAMAGTLQVALVDSGYTFSAAHTAWADASASEITGTGYTAGGATVAGVTLTTTTTDDLTVDGTDVVWTAATLTARRAIVYYSGTLNGVVNPVLWSILLDDTPADVSVTSTDMTIQWAAAGLLTATVA